MAISNLGKASTLKNRQGSDRGCSSKKEHRAFTRQGRFETPTKLLSRTQDDYGIRGFASQLQEIYGLYGWRNKSGCATKKTFDFKGKTQKFYTLSRVAEAKTF
jgi:hypothetical protein